MSMTTELLTAGEHYPFGPCDLPLICRDCGETITEDNVVNYRCEDDCELCSYCGDGRCPYCGTHWHCGGCV